MNEWTNTWTGEFRENRQYLKNARELFWPFELPPTLLKSNFFQLFFLDAWHSTIGSPVALHHGLANPEPTGQSQPTACFVNKVLLEQSNAHWAEVSNDDTTSAPQCWIYLLHDLFIKKSCQPATTPSPPLLCFPSSRTPTWVYIRHWLAYLQDPSCTDFALFTVSTPQMFAE